MARFEISTSAVRSSCHHRRMVATPEQSARIWKFLRRAEIALTGRVYEHRGMEEGDFSMQLTWETDEGTGEMRLVEVDYGVDEYTEDELAATAARCRVFILKREDNYLPSVVAVVRRAVSAEVSRKLVPLKKYVGEHIQEDQLVGASFYSGRLESDNGLGPNQLLGNDQIAMDFINGKLFHEDDRAAARLRNVASSDTLKLAIVMKLNDLMRVVHAVKTQIETLISDGSLVLTEEPGSDELQSDAT